MTSKDACIAQRRIRRSHHSLPPAQNTGHFYNNFSLTRVIKNQGPSGSPVFFRDHAFFRIYTRAGFMIQFIRQPNFQFWQTRGNAAAAKQTLHSKCDL